jgi:hypothetical protein
MGLFYFKSKFWLFSIVNFRNFWLCIMHFITLLHFIYCTWYNFAVLSTPLKTFLPDQPKKFGCWTNIVVFFTDSECQIVETFWVYQWEVTTVCKKYDCFRAKWNYKKDQPLFWPFFDTKSSAPDFPGPTQFCFSPFALRGRNLGPLATSNFVIDLSVALIQEKILI